MVELAAGMWQLGWGCVWGEGLAKSDPGRPRGATGNARLLHAPLLIILFLEPGTGGVFQLLCRDRAWAHSSGLI